jgi:hypothetical protein
MMLGTRSSQSVTSWEKTHLEQTLMEDVCDPDA